MAGGGFVDCVIDSRVELIAYVPAGIHYVQRSSIDCGNASERAAGINFSQLV